MSGYLQRMARRTLHPGGSIRPVLGSLFAAPLRHDALEFDRARDDSVSRNVADSDENSLLSDESEFSVVRSREVDKPSPLRVELPQPAVDEALRPPRPLLPESGEPIEPGQPPVTVRAGTATSSIRDADSGANIESRFARENVAGNQHGESRPRRQSADAVGQYEPIATRPVRAPALTAPTPAGAFRKEIANGDRSRLQQETTDRASHEIEIHIGRIEVTAVPQSSMPAPAKPTSKSSSLEDYLKRRDARAR